MSENGEGLPKTSKSGGEIDLRDDLGSQYRDRDELIRKRRSRKLVQSKVLTNPKTPQIKPEGLKPWNTEMVRPHKDGTYRTVDPKTGKITS